MKNRISLDKAKRIGAFARVLSFALVLVLICGALTGCYHRKKKKSKNIAVYNSYVSDVGNAEKFMPDCEHDLGVYRSVLFGFQETSLLFFYSQTLTLTASYDETNYEKEKSAALDRFDFLEEPYQEKDGDYIFPVTNFEYDGYSFSIVPDRDYNLDGTLGCHSFMMVGYNDTKMKIAYLYFYDPDLDYLSEENATEEEKQKRMPELIKDSFVWFG